MGSTSLLWTVLYYFAKGLYIGPHSVKKSKLFCIPRHFLIYIISVLKAKYGLLLNSAAMEYEGAMISRLLKTIGLFCRIWSLLQGSFEKKRRIILRSLLIEGSP